MWPTLAAPGAIRSLAHQIEAVLDDILLLGVLDGQLACDAIEIIGTPEHYEVVRPRIEIALDPDIAEAADLAVQVNAQVALELVPVLRPALAAILTDLVVAVVGSKSLSLKTNALWPTTWLDFGFATTVK